jgi:tetratricopeptide (TPR) repeat protein
MRDKFRLTRQARRFWTVLLLAMGLVCLAPPAQAFTLAQLAARADAYYEQRGELDKAARGADLYRQILAARPGDLAASLRLCELLVWIGAQSPAPVNEDCFREVIVVAKAARQAHPQDPGPLFWLGVGQGMLADVASVPEALFLVSQARKNMDQLLRQAPGYYHGGADRVLGRIYTKLPSFMGGDPLLAERHYKHAIKNGPHYWLNHLYLAELYYRQGQKQKAKLLLEKVTRGKVMPGLLPECRLWQSLARKALASGKPPE